MSETSDKVICECGARGKSARLPRGWKRHDGRVWCDACWRAGWKLRAIPIPIAGPVDGSWEELRAALSACWASSTRLANWATTQLYARDVRREPGVEKMPPMPKIYLYPEARQVEPGMDTRAVVSLLQSVERRYRARRYDVIWRASESLPNFRWPVPYPLHCDSWSVSRAENGPRLLSARLDGRRWSLRLRGGPRHYRTLASVDALITGRAKQGELSIYQTVAYSSHRPGATATTDLMAKMVVWLPKRESAHGDATLRVRTASESLWVYRADDEEPRYLHADQVKRWIAAHRAKLHRISADTKCEKRRPRRMMKGINEQRERWCCKQHRRLESFCHEATAMLVKFAVRQGCGLVEYDDRVQTFADLFPYHRLRTLLAYKLDERGITFNLTSGDAADESPDPLEQETKS